MVFCLLFFSFFFARQKESNRPALSFSLSLSSSATVPSVSSPASFSSSKSAMWSLAAGRLQLGNPSDAATLAALAAPHVLYGAVWLHAPLWRRAFGRKAVPVLEWAALVGKRE